VSWHVQPETMDGYVHGRIDDAAASSLEAHVLACWSCRVELSSHIERDRSERIWQGVRGRIDDPGLGVVERSLVRLGIPAHTARLLVATPSLRSGWLLAVAASLALAVIASRTIADASLPFLVLAPLIPLTGVAAAIGRPADPAWEIGLASPTGGFRLLLIRTTGVLVTSTGLAGLAALGLQGLGWGAAAWLLPSLALTVLTLVLSTTALSPTTAAVLVGAAWVVGVGVLERLSSVPLVEFGHTAQIAFAVVAAASAVVLAGRREPFERRTRLGTGMT
jgi:anti-sigma factor RsiW